MRSPPVALAAAVCCCACARPSRAPDPGAYVDVVALDASHAVAVREHVIELQHDGVQWRSPLEGYAGSPLVAGVGASGDEITVRVVRDGRPEVVVLRARDGARTATLAIAPDWPPSPRGYSLEHVMTVPAGDQVYELAGDATHGIVVAVADGAVRWRHEVNGRIELAAAAGPDLALVVDGAVQRIDPAGRVTSIGGAVQIGDTRGHPYSLTSDVASVLVPDAPAPPRVPDAIFDPSTRTLTTAGRSIAWPPGALAPEPHHRAGGMIWVVYPDRLDQLRLFDPVAP